MQQYSQILINSLIFIELVLALCLVFLLTLASKKVIRARVYIEEHLGEQVEILVEVRRQVRSFNRLAEFLKVLKGYAKLKNVVTSTFDILGILLLLTPGTGAMKMRRFLSAEILKKGLSLLKQA